MKRPRLSVEITSEQQKALERLIPWGQQKAIFGVIVDELIVVLSKHGPMAIGAILAKKLSFLNVLEAQEKIK